MSNLALKIATEFPSQGVLMDLGGMPVDASGWVWRLNHAGAVRTLNWRALEIRSESILEATAQYIARLVTSHSSDAVRGTFDTLKYIKHSPSFVLADASGNEIPETFFSELRHYFGASDWRLHHFRHWYRSCADFGAENFSAEVAFLLDEKTVGGNRKGHSVLSLDPEDGPLSDLETTGLLNALNARRNSNTMSLSEQAALWLCIALGCNPIQFALLREEDVEVFGEGPDRFVQIRIPRMKKRSQRPREDFRTRKLTAEIGDVVLDLIDLNRSRRAVDGWSDPRHAFPLFVREKPRVEHVDGPLVEYARHLYSQEFTDLVGQAVSELAVVSPRTGKRLKVSTRRLRYTFATRLVREGASMRELADALDHTDLQQVRVYFDIKSDIVESLDKSMALALGPVAQAFLGKLVRSEGDAKRGDDPTSQIAVQDKETGEAFGVGTCGKHSFCALMAPVACYTCASFQPWLDGPHDRILDDLLTKRDRKLAAGQDGRMVAIHDATILAIGDVIRRIEAVQRGPSA